MLELMLEPQWCRSVYFAALTDGLCAKVIANMPATQHFRLHGTSNSPPDHLLYRLRHPDLPSSSILIVVNVDIGSR